MSVTPEEVAQFDLACFFESSTAHTEEIAETQFRENLALLRKFHPIDSASRILEIGTGLGWFQVMCLRNGVQCEGVELSPQLLEHALRLGEQYGLQLKIQLGNIEDTDIGLSRYDCIIAESVLEHVPDWKRTIHKVYHALKPRGVFYFCSTNKFSLVSGEFPRVPLYGWLPNRLRRWIRMKAQGPGVMLWCMDFNQFRYPPLRKFLKQVGFREVFDYVEMKDADALNNPSRLRRLLMKTLKSSRLAKRLFLTFKETTVFLCRK